MLLMFLCHVFNITALNNVEHHTEMKFHANLIETDGLRDGEDLDLTMIAQTMVDNIHAL